MSNVAGPRPRHRSLNALVERSLGDIKNLFHFANLAKTDWREAVDLFYSSEFISLFDGTEGSYESLYRGLSEIPGNEQNVEEFLISIVRQLVDDPEQVTVEVEENENNTVLKLSVAPEDMGRVIGREGRVARALRTVAKAAFRNNPKPVYIDIVDKAE